MSFLGGFLGLCSSVSTGSATEVTGITGYARCPISFEAPHPTRADEGLPAGSTVVARNIRGWGFASGLAAGQVVGRALWDHPTQGAGSLLLVLPFGNSARPFGSGGRYDRGEPGDLTLIFTDVQAIGDGEVWSTKYAAGSVIGTCFDSADIISRAAQVNPQNGHYIMNYAAGVISTASPLYVTGGRMQATDRWPL